MNTKALQEPSQLAARLELFKPSRAEPCIKSARSSRAGLPKLEPKCGLAQKARAEMWLGSKARAEPRAGSVFLFILKLFTFYNFHSSIQQINTIVVLQDRFQNRNRFQTGLGVLSPVSDHFFRLTGFLFKTGFKMQTGLKFETGLHFETGLRRKLNYL